MSKKLKFKCWVEVFGIHFIIEKCEGGDIDDIGRLSRTQITRVSAS
jgi:hypothetical protein